MIRYSIETSDRIHVKGYGFISFTKNITQNVSSKYGQKLLDRGHSIITLSQNAQNLEPPLPPLPSHFCLHLFILSSSLFPPSRTLKT